MATTFVYLNEEEITSLQEGKPIEVPVTQGIKNSRRIVIRKDMSEVETHDGIGAT